MLDVDGKTTEQSGTPASKQPLYEKYRPRNIQDFAGLATPKRVLRSFAKKPFSSAWLFTGRSGSGKSAMATALASELPAQLHVLPALQCTRENLRRLDSRCQQTPPVSASMHLVLVDQADKLTKMQQTDFRSLLERAPTQPPVIWVFTAISDDALDDGFRSRCHVVPFSTHGIAPEATALLESIWDSEVKDAHRTRPNFKRIVKEANNNIRAALVRLETELIA